MKFFTLLQLNRSIQKLFQQIDRPLWISAEVANAQFRTHCFLELVQKEEEDIVARNRAVAWESTLLQMREKLGEHLENLLQQGTRILVQVKVNYHEVHGLSLVVLDIDPAYTIGELELQRQKTLRQLAAEGLDKRQQAISLPLVPQRIAVISSPEAAGYADFMNQLVSNEYGYAFYTRLFATSVQGARAVPGIITALQAASKGGFDAIALIRGGGSRLDLEAFNSLELARAVAMLPLPLLAGIGHQTDVSVADTVAFRSLKTPTAVASFLVERALMFESRLLESFEQIADEVQTRLGAEKEQLNRLQTGINTSASSLLKTGQMRLQHLSASLQQQVKFNIGRTLDKLFFLEKNIMLLALAALMENPPAGAVTYRQARKYAPSRPLTRLQVP